MPISTTKQAAGGEEPTKAAGAGSLSKTIKVLEMVVGASPAPSAAAITEALGLPRPTTNRIISNLIRLKLLKRAVKRRELIEDERLLKLAVAVLTQAAQRGPRHEILQELSSKTKETCNVGMIVSGRVQYVDRIESQWPLSLRLEPGSTIPLHCTALGKLLLSHLPEAHREKYLSTITLSRYTKNTITDLGQLRTELESIAQSGVSIDREEYLSGVLGMAVAIPHPQQFPILGLALAVPSARTTPAELEKNLPDLKQAAEHLALCYY